MTKTMMLAALLATSAAGTVAVAGSPAPTTTAAKPWMTTSLSADQRTKLLLKAMTTDDKLTLVFGYFGSIKTDSDYKRPPESLEGSAGYVPGIARLGITPQWETDAGIGVATQGSSPTKRERTALPSGIATAATWNPDLAHRGGAMIGDEARQSGFNVMLAGGVDLLRDPRNGRNFEYGGEDPLLAGTIVGNEIAGIQSNHVISTIKHYAMNDQETGRNNGNEIIADAAARVSDLLAFEIAIENGDPGSVMCSYNLVNGVHACENPYLLTDVLRRDWGYKGYVMSDWGGAHSTVAAANAGLDQDSGYPFDKEPYFGKPLKAAVASGEVSKATLDRMAGGILHGMFTTGVFDAPVAAPGGTIDYAAHAAVTRADAEQAIVLLKNADHVLPLSPDTKSIVIIGGHADKGVLAGGGSSMVYPRGGNAVPGITPTSWPGPVMYYPSSPMAAIQRQAPRATVRYVDGSDPAAAAAAAKSADVAIVFVTQWTGESFDAPIQLAANQDALVAAVAGANPKTVVVAETGGPVLMPWIDHVAGAIEAWYPGTEGGAAIGDILFGKVNPSGHLPATIPASLDQLVRPGEIDPSGAKENDPVTVHYTEGAAVGYKWFDKNKLQPAFAFGHGLSYTSFGFDGLKAAPANGTLSASFTVTNTGKVAGMAVPQLYVGPVAGGWEAPKRLGGWQKIELAPGASKTVSVTVDPRLLATYDSANRSWKIAAGDYRVMLAHSARAIDKTVTVHLAARSLPAGWHP